MFNNRMLAVAAVLVMAVPALGAATPIVVPPVPEQLVEGHTVFTVIEIVRQTTVTEARFAAAVAVLVREVNNVREAQRFPGVLWFNDQYLVNPTSSRDAEANFRYPCGGAVMAVNAGDPDPRMVLARLNDDGDLQAPGDGLVPTSNVGEVGDGNHTYLASDYWVKPDTSAGDFTGYYGQDSGGPGDPATDYAWIGTDSDGDFKSDTVLTNGVDYDESYLITDPNDHSWIIDKYNMYTRTEGDTLVDFATAGTTTVVYNFPVWVVNILGAPVFTLDEGDDLASTISSTVNCLPYLDILPEQVQAVTCGADSPIPGGIGGPNHFEDNPCMGYMEPSTPNGYCYGGQPNSDSNGDTVVDGADCQFARAAGETSEKPFRYYNALLYFRLEDLTVRDADKINHDVSADTNGCSEEQYWWGPNPPMAADQYPCPGDDDDAEGNSHPFHPATPPSAHTHAEDCPDAFGGPNPTNHGGSTYITGKGHDADGYYFPGPFPCDWSHATFNIDIYFSGGGRPFPPPVPDFWITDLQGSSAPFNGQDGSSGGTLGAGDGSSSGAPTGGH